MKGEENSKGSDGGKSLMEKKMDCLMKCSGCNMQDNVSNSKNEDCSDKQLKAQK